MALSASRIDEDVSKSYSIFYVYSQCAHGQSAPESDVYR
jgi:hypothetical protein